MLRRRQINAGPGAASSHSPLAMATNPVREVAWIVEERVMWRGADLLRGIADAARWPFERLAWLLERRLIWPVREHRTGLRPPGLAAGAGALAAVLIGAGALGIVATSGGNADRAQVATPAGPTIASHPTASQSQSRPQPQPQPVLHGAPPVFGAAASVGAAQATGEAPTRVAAAKPKEVATAAASSAKPVPAGPAAMKVARRFAEAFVFYEIGQRPARARTVFGETATPGLSQALAERPPRLPERTKVPKARVVNLVPGPRHDRAYTVSVSLLRVGVTSELRLDLQRDGQGGGWRVTNVVG